MPTAKKEMQRKRHFMKGFELPSEPDEDEDFGVGGQRDPGRGKMDIEVEEIVQYESKQSKTHYWFLLHFIVPTSNQKVEH